MSSGQAAASTIVHASQTNTNQLKSERHHRRRTRTKRRHRGLTFESLEQRRVLTTIIVDSLADNTTIDSQITLREALLAANNDSSVGDAPAGFGADTIRFAPALSGTLSMNPSLGQFTISDDVTIEGPGADLITLDASASSSRVLQVNGLQNHAEISGLRFTSTSTSSTGGAIQTFGSLILRDIAVEASSATSHGGGIYASLGGGEFLAISHSSIEGNQTSSNGGGIYVYNSGGSFTMDRVSVSNNSASGASSDGGGVYVRQFAGVTQLNDSTLNGNSATLFGGGLSVEQDGGFVSIQRVTVDQNDATNGTGGGIDADILGGTFSISGATISGNTAYTFGGGLNVNGNVTVEHSTLSGNKVNHLLSQGGGVFQQNGSVTLDHSLVANNSRYASIPSDLEGTFTATYTLVESAAGHNVIDGASGNIVGSDPSLSDLADNGGGRQTHALMSGSVAIDAGDAAFAGIPINDGRGAPFERVFDGDASSGARIDIGAYEVQSLDLMVDTVVDEIDFDHSAGDLSLREAASLSNNPGNDTVSFSPDIHGQTLVVDLGAIMIADDVTIVGPGENLLTLDTNGLSAIFDIDDSDNANHKDVSISGLRFVDGGGGSGWGITSTENLTLTNAIFENGTGAALALGARPGSTTLTRNVTVQGNSLSGGFFGGAGILVFNEGGTITIEDSTVTGNVASKNGGGVSLYNQSGDTIIRRSQITGNQTTSSSDEGGGIVIAIDGGNVLIERTIIADNKTLGTSSEGGGLWADVNGGSVTIRDSTISGNTAEGGSSQGGGVFMDISSGGNVLVERSTISNNRTLDANAEGGGLYIDNSGNAEIVSSTISGNRTPSSGGGLYINGDLLIAHSTIADNDADSPGDNSGDGGGVYAASGTLTLDHTIVADNSNTTSSTPDDIFVDSATVIGVYSWIEAPGTTSIGGTGNTTLLDPNLGPLRHNGGPTMTHALQPGGITPIDAGNPTITGEPSSDGRGLPFARVVDGDGLIGSRIDIGAFEAGQSISMIVDTAVDENDGDYSVGDVSLREAIQLTNNPAYVNGSVTTGFDTIDFTPSLAGQTIELALGQLEIRNAVTINGLGSDLLTIDAKGNSRVFDIDGFSGATPSGANIHDLTLTGGFASIGGAVRSDNQLSLVDSVLTGNTATFDGGGLNARIYSGSALSILRTRISGNTTLKNDSDGGGVSIYQRSGTTVDIIDSAISNNVSFGAGATGAGLYIYSEGTLNLEALQVENNRSDGSDTKGGGVYVKASQNSQVTITDSSILNNELNGANSDGGGVWLRAGSSDTTITMENNLVAGNHATEQGGGVRAISRGTVSLTQVEVTENGLSTVAGQAGNGVGGGGGMYLESVDGGTVTLTDGTIRGNTTSDGIPGGGLFLNSMDSSSLIDVIDSVITGNQTSGMAGRGGGLSIIGDSEVGLTNVSVKDNATDGDQAHGGGLHVQSSGTITATSVIVDSNITQGYNSDGGGAYVSIVGSGSFNATGSSITDNSTANYGSEGGGLSIQTNGAPSVTLTNSSVTDNTTSGSNSSGGGIWVRHGGSLPLAITDSTISGNRTMGTSGQGAGLYSGYTVPSSIVDVQRSTISGNTSSSLGGGILNRDDGLQLTNSTVSGNSAPVGGGIFSYTDFSVQHSTVTNNSSVENSCSFGGQLGCGGGIVMSEDSTLTLNHSIVAENHDPGNVDDLGVVTGGIVNASNSLIGDNRGSGLSEANPDLNGNIIGGPNFGAIDPMLAPLGSFGGLTKTHAALPGSPAINAGSVSFIPPPNEDQRGTPFTRVANGRIDIGAVELQESVFVVNSTANGADANFGDGICQTSVPGQCTLRAAIQEANANANGVGPDLITFAIGTGAQTISPASSLPSIDDPVIIDGASQPGFIGTPLVTIDGSSIASGLVDGLRVESDSATIRGLHFRGFSGDGIEVVSAAGALIDGVHSTDNGRNGIRFTSATGSTLTNSQIGNNAFAGVQLGDSGSTGNTVSNNLIGVLDNGTVQAAPNDTFGIRVTAGDNVISGNTISSNTLSGLSIATVTASNNQVVNNFVGTNPVGDAVMPNGSFGVVLRSPDNVVDGNVISGNGRSGLVISGGSATGNQVVGNFVGTSANGNSGLGNSSFGILIVDADDNIIGGPLMHDRNVISDNGSSGLVLSIGSTDNTIENNLIGITLAGTDLGNGGNGVNLRSGASNNSIRNNSVAGNTASQIVLSSATTTNNSFTGNLVGFAPGFVLVPGSANGFSISAPGNTVGGTQPSDRNYIAGTTNGLTLSGTNAQGNVVQGNTIGTDNANSNYGVTAGVQFTSGAANNVVGPGNVIAFSTSDAVRNSSGGEGNTITQNTMFGNVFGIDLGSNLTTPNDGNPAAQDATDDADLGPNKLQNTAESISVDLAVTSQADWTFTYTVDTNPANANYPLTVEFFVSDPVVAQSVHPIVTTTFSEADYNTGLPIVFGHTTSLSEHFSIPVLVQSITASVTDADGNTSEFSAPETINLTGGSSRVASSGESSDGSTDDLSTQNEVGVTGLDSNQESNEESEQIELPPPPPPINYHKKDVSGDGVITSRDALIVINAVNLKGGEGEAIDDATSNSRLDVNDDGRITALDALSIINHINTQSDPLSASEVDSAFAEDDEDFLFEEDLAGVLF